MQAECGKCKFWWPIPNAPMPSGQCRRNPRTVLVVGYVAPALQGQPPIPQFGSYHPVEPPDGWCGEFSAAPSVNGKPMPIDFSKLETETLN